MVARVKSITRLKVRLADKKGRGLNIKASALHAAESPTQPRMESSRSGEDRSLKPLVDGLHSRIGIVRLLPYHFSHWANTPHNTPLGERALLKLQKPDG